MNIQQFEYITALDQLRNFGKAAEKCFVTQPALTIQVKKLEEELGAQIFDRTKKPVIPTEVGELIIEQARLILQETEKFSDIIDSFKKEISGELKLGIIPTVSPYLTPLFISSFTKNYPLVKLSVKEEITEDIIKELKNGQIDAGIIVTPFETSNMKVLPLFYERFFAYVSSDHPLYKKNKLKTSDLQLNDTWILKEGNCFRNQVINVCSLSPGTKLKGSFNYESVSIDSLKRIVEKQRGITVLPQLAMMEIENRKKKMIKPFSDSSPAREISLIVSRSFLKKNLIDKLVEEIRNNLPKQIKTNKGNKIIDTRI